MRVNGSSYQKSNTYHTETSGLTGRINMTITDMMSMYIDVEHNTQDAVLPYITFSYNTAQQDTTRTTPFFLLYGRQVTTMFDAMLSYDSCDDNMSVKEFIERAEAQPLARS